jgi:murein DD-endopeptidase MepM/ murein hydrolase activator NlpD
MSKKVKYYYDADSLTYKKVKLKTRRKIGFALLFIVASALFGVLAFLILLNSSFFETPKDKLLAREIENLSLNYKVLNKKLDQIDNVLGNIEDRDNNLYRAYFNATPITEEKRKELIVSKNRYKEINGFNNSALVSNTMKRVDIISKQLAVQSKSLDEILKLAEAKNDLLEAIPAIQPVKNEDLKRMASGFGYRSDPFTKATKFHKGMDFTSNTGTPIYATGNGVVTNADNSLSGYGNHVEIQHGFGYKTLYAHMSRYNCKPGQKVKRGDVIGFVGSTGRSQGPHLHYEVYKDGEVVNPLNFYYGNISAAEYTVISKIANQENQSLD